MKLCYKQSSGLLDHILLCVSSGFFLHFSITASPMEFLFNIQWSDAPLMTKQHQGKITKQQMWITRLMPGEGFLFSRVQMQCGKYNCNMQTQIWNVNIFISGIRPFVFPTLLKCTYIQEHVVACAVWYLSCDSAQSGDAEGARFTQTAVFWSEVWDRMDLPEPVPNVNP